MGKEKTYLQIRSAKIKSFSSEQNKLMKELTPLIKRFALLSKEEMNRYIGINNRLKEMQEVLSRMLDSDKKNIELSLKLSEMKPAVKQSCFYNASTSLTILSNKLECRDVYYVEGFINRNQTLIEHGWIQCEDGIVDPTLPEDDLRYIPVNYYTPEQMIKIIASNNGNTPLFQFVKKDRKNMDERRDAMLNAQRDLKCISNDIPVYYRDKQ